MDADDLPFIFAFVSTALLDGSETLNTASFVHTFMPKEADKLMMENIGKNFVDGDEYPSTQLIHNRWYVNVSPPSPSRAKRKLSLWPFLLASLYAVFP